MMLRFRLVTPERTLFDEEVSSVSLPTPTGEITVLPNHATLATLLSAGIVRCHLANGKEEEVAVSGGFLNIQPDGQITALADSAERGEELELSIIEEARKRAQEVMSKAASVDDVAFASAAAGLERELARYRLATKYRTPRNAPAIERASIKHEKNAE